MLVDLAGEVDGAAGGNIGDVQRDKVGGAAAVRQRGPRGGVLGRAQRPYTSEHRVNCRGTYAAGSRSGSTANCRATLPPIMRAISGSATLASRKRASASQAVRGRGTVRSETGRGSNLGWKVPRPVRVVPSRPARGADAGSGRGRGD